MNKRNLFLAGSILALSGLIAGLFTSTVKAGGPALDPNGQREIENPEIPIPSRSENQRMTRNPSRPLRLMKKGSRSCFRCRVKILGMVMVGWAPGWVI